MNTTLHHSNFAKNTLDTVVFLVEGPAEADLSTLLRESVAKRIESDASAVTFLGSVAFTHSEGTDVHLGDDANEMTAVDRKAFRGLDIIVNVSIKREDACTYADYRLRITSKPQGDEARTYFCEGRGRLNQPMKFSFSPDGNGRCKHLVVWPKRDGEGDSRMEAAGSER